MKKVLVLTLAIAGQMMASNDNGMLVPVMYIQNALEDIHEHGGATLSTRKSCVNPEGLLIEDKNDARYSFFQDADMLADYLNCLAKDTVKASSNGQMMVKPMDLYQSAYYEKMKARLLALKAALNGANSMEIQQRLAMNGLLQTFMEGNFGLQNSDLMDYLMKNVMDETMITHDNKNYIEGQLEQIDASIDGMTPLEFAITLDNISLAKFLLFDCLARPMASNYELASDAMQRVITRAREYTLQLRPVCSNELQGHHKRARKHHVRRNLN